MRGSKGHAVALLGKESSWRALGYWRRETTTTGRRERVCERRTAILGKPALHVLVEEKENSVEGCGNSKDELMEEKFEEFVNDCQGGRRGEQSCQAAN
jgi:hypothetical protein